MLSGAREARRERDGMTVEFAAESWRGLRWAATPYWDPDLGCESRLGRTIGHFVVPGAALTDVPRCLPVRSCCCGVPMGKES
jgi:hypothetical protein